MKNLCLVVVCMLGFACSSEGKSEKPEIYQQWSDGKAIVVIVDANEDSDSEHYADWSTTSTNSPNRPDRNSCFTSWRHKLAKVPSIWKN